MFMSQIPPPSHHDPDLHAPRPQPPIWVEGRQSPAFALGAWLTVSRVLARRRLGPALAQTAAALDGAGNRWRSGALRVDCARLGRVAAGIPSHQTIGRGILWLAQLTRDTGQIVLPGPEPAVPLAYPDLLSPRSDPAPRPQRPTRRLALRAADSPAPEAPILRSIRGLLAETARDADRGAVVVPLHRRVDPAPQDARPQTAAASGIAWLLRRALSPVLAFVLLSMFLIPGAISAVLLHLNGTDLRNWQ